MRKLILTLALFLTFVPAAFAGGVHALIEGPDPKSRNYTARTYSCDPKVRPEPWAIAEGVIDGKRKSVLIRLEPTGEHGVYRFKRTWPAEGRWMIRLSLGLPPAPATVTTLRADGSVENNRLYFNTDGHLECQRALDPDFTDDGC